MADTKISLLADGVTPQVTDRLPAQRGAGNVGLTVQQLATFVGASIPAGPAGPANQYDTERAQLSMRAPVARIVTATNSTIGADRKITGGANSDTRIDIILSAAQIASGLVNVDVRLFSGAFSAATVEQRSGTVGAGAQVVAPVALTAEGTRRITRGIPLNVATTFLRVYLQTGAGGSAVFYAPAVTDGGTEPASARMDGNLVALDQLLVDVANAAPNLITAPATITTFVGLPPVRTGDSYAVSAGVSADFDFVTAGLLNTDTVTVMFKASAPAALFRVTPTQGGGVNGPAVEALDLGGGYYGLLGVPAVVSGGGASTRVLLRIDTRAGAGYPAQSLTLSEFWVARNVTTFRGIGRVPAPVALALTNARVGVAYVDAAGGLDVNSGTSAQPYQTISAALASGASTIFLRVNAPHRITASIALTNLDTITFAAWRKSTDTVGAKARILGSVAQPAANWTADTTFTNLSWIPATQSPFGLFEISAAGVVSRITHTPKGPTTPTDQAPSLAACAAGAAVAASAVATSTTTHTPSIATKVLATNVDALGYVNDRVRLISAGNAAIWMEGFVTWTGRTLSVAVDRIGTATAASDWQVFACGNGSWFYDAGTSRLYVNPIADAIAGKTYEVPTANKILALLGCAEVGLRDIEFSYSRDTTVDVDRSSGRSENCLFGRSGNGLGGGNGCNITNYSTWVDQGSTFRECGNDGFGFGLGSEARFTNSWFVDCRGDGISRDGDLTSQSMTGCLGENNGKGGAVFIGSGTVFDMAGRWVGNGGQDFLGVLTAGGSRVGKVVVHDTIAETFYFDAGASGTMRVDMDGCEGSAYFDGAGCKAFLTRPKVRANGKVSFYGIRAIAAAVEVTDPTIRNFTYGLFLSGAGTLKVRGGSVLRCTGAGVFQTAGTLDLDTNDPVNVPSSGTTGANAAQTSGVSAGDILKLISIAAN